MKSPCVRLICTLVVILAGSLVIDGQEAISNANDTSSGAPTLLGSLENFKTGEEGALLLDLLRIGLEKNENSRGAILIFCAKVCKYGEIEAHIAGLRRAMNLRKTPADRILIVIAGFRDATTTEFWHILADQQVPIPRSTIKFEDAEIKGNFAKRIVPYECCY